MTFGCALLVIGSWAAAVTGSARAAEPERGAFPVKPIRLIVPFAAAGPTDAIARVIAQGLSEATRQQVMVDNRPGANAIIGTELGAKAPPDGYTLVMFAFPHGVNPGMYPRLPYDTRRDFAPIVLVASGPMLLTAHPSVPARTVRQLLDLARAKPDELTCASSGSGSTAHLALALMTHDARVRIRHVPYKGAGQAAIDVVGGHVSLYFGGVVALLPQVKAGKLRALAVSTNTRARAAPDVPTVAESGLPGYDVRGWYGIVAPAKTSREVIGTLHTALSGVLRRADVVNTLSANGAEVVGGTPEAFGAYIDSEIVRWAKVLKETGITAE
jgi:tripartite-type tricarboxylate transporter receptor subunit TctC